jgi:hypothetical protein
MASPSLPHEELEKKAIVPGNRRYRKKGRLE